jgi:hypothetical protein
MWLADRLAEKSSQVALGAGIIATCGVAAIPASWSASGAAAWLALIPVWGQSLVHVCLPDAISGTNLDNSDKFRQISTNGTNGTNTDLSRPVPFVASSLHQSLGVPNPPGSV